MNTEDEPSIEERQEVARIRARYCLVRVSMYRWGVGKLAVETGRFRHLGDFVHVELLEGYERLKWLPAAAKLHELISQESPT